MPGCSTDRLQRACRERLEPCNLQDDGRPQGGLLQVVLATKLLLQGIEGSHDD